MPRRFANRPEELKSLARSLRGREGELTAYDSSHATYARAKARIARDYPDGWGPLKAGSAVDEVPMHHKERAAALQFSRQLDKLISDTIRERTKVRYYAEALEEELDEAGVDPVALLAEVDESDSGE